jgi:hypothetical protein
MDEVLRGVRRRVPSGVPGSPALAVRQRFGADAYPGNDSLRSEDDEHARAARWARADAAAGTPEAVAVGTTWGDGVSEAAFAASVGYRLIVGHAWRGEWQVCGARGALLIWLVGQATTRTADGLHRLDDSSWGALVLQDGGLEAGPAVPDRDAAAGLALLQRPADEVAPLVAAHWAELTAAGTDTGRFGAVFGIPVQPQPPAEEHLGCAG